MNQLYLLLLIAVVAFLYASVGHGGASGYLAMMAIFSISPDEAKPTALILNIVVSALSFSMYYRAGYFKWKLLLPFIIFSIPMAFIGGNIKVEKHVYEIILAVCLVLATLRLLGAFGKGTESADEIKPIPFTPALLIGGLLGLVSGMIGIGGGILLSPVLLLLRWADMKQTAAISAAFILVNSVAGLAGNFLPIGSTGAAPVFQPHMLIWVLAALAGGLPGAFYGSHRFNFKALKYILSVVLLFATTKLVIEYIRHVIS